MITIDNETCIGCRSCYEVCPEYVFTTDKNNNKKVSVLYADHCCSCGHCISVCPENAVHHEKLPDDTFISLSDNAIESEDLMKLIMARRSIRKYKEKSVPEEQINQLIESVVHAGTGGNIQAEDIIVVQDQTFLSELELLVVDSLWRGGIKFFTGKGVLPKILKKKFGPVLSYQYSKYNRIIRRRREDNALADMVFRGAPIVIIIHGLKENNLTQTNAALALRNIELMAQTMGLGTCYSGFLVSASEMKRKTINNFIGIDNSRQISGALMLGYPKYKYKQILPRNKREVRWI